MTKMSSNFQELNVTDMVMIWVKIQGSVDCSLGRKEGRP